MSNDISNLMPLMAHLKELRTCLIRTVLGICVGATIGCYFSEYIFQILTYPIRHSSSAFSLIGTSPAEAFMIKLKVGISSGFLLSLPYTFYQVWNFVAPGLHEKERRYAIPFIVACTLCFLCGVAFCFFIALPFALSYFLEEYASIGVAANIKISDYLEFALNIILVFGLVFELPIITLFLAKLGLVSHFFLLKHVRVSIVIIFIAAAILTPPDIVSQILLAVPLLILYAICILVAYQFRDKFQAESKATNNEPAQETQ